MKDLLTRGVAEVIEHSHLEKALKSKKKLRLKLGIDPTAPDLHLGHAVVLRKLKQFQDLGHKVILIIGDFTAQIGDPSGRSEERKPLSKKEIKKNLKTYLEQAGKVINTKKAEIRRNSEWHGEQGAMFMSNLYDTARVITLQQVMEREDFGKRFQEGSPLTMLEALYPLFQGYDSVAVKADVEFGGTDQKFNLLMGRRVQRAFHQPEQDILTVPLLEGTDGIKKMSKSFGNYIALDDPPAEMFGKVMSIKDSLIIKYFELCTDVMEKRIAQIKKLLKSKKLNPRDAKMVLAFEIVSLYHGRAKAEKAKEGWEKLFSKKELPSKLPTLRLPPGTTATFLVFQSKVAKSQSEARRLVEQGALEIDGHVWRDPRATLKLFDGQVVRVRIGKKSFFRVKIVR